MELERVCDRSIVHVRERERACERGRKTADFFVCLCLRVLVFVCVCARVCVCACVREWCVCRV